MSNDYYFLANPLVAGDLARANDINEQLMAVEVGFDKIPNEAELKKGAVNFALDTGVVNAYQVSPVYPFTDYTQGQTVIFKAATTNTGQSTLAVSGLAAKSIYNSQGQPLISGDIQAGSLVLVIYDGTGFRSINGLTGYINTANVPDHFMFIPAWISGNEYQAGDMVYSPVDFQAYRCMVNNSSVIDPSENTENWQPVNPVIRLSYADRANIRARGVGGDVAIIEGIGLFVFYAGSEELDDDESCFATATGRWLLEAVGYDFVKAYQNFELSPVRADVTGLQADVTGLQADVMGLQADVTGLQADVTGLQADVTGLQADVTGLQADVTGLQADVMGLQADVMGLQAAPKILLGSVSWTLTSLATVSQTSKTVTVTGATTSDVVVVAPPNGLGAKISVYGMVSAANTVTIYANNPSASTQVLTSGTWKVAVIQA